MEEFKLYIFGQRRRQTLQIHLLCVSIQGRKAIEAIEADNSDAARKALQTAINLSDKLMNILDELDSKVQKLEESGEVAV